MQNTFFSAGSYGLSSYVNPNSRRTNGTNPLGKGTARCEGKDRLARPIDRFNMQVRTAYFYHKCSPESCRKSVWTARLCRGPRASRLVSSLGAPSRRLIALRLLFFSRFLYLPTLSLSKVAQEVRGLLSRSAATGRKMARSQSFFSQRLEATLSGRSLIFRIHPPSAPSLSFHSNPGAMTHLA